MPFTPRTRVLRYDRDVGRRWARGDRGLTGMVGSVPVAPWGAAWRGDRAAECGGLENRCAPSAPGVRIPLSPLQPDWYAYTACTFLSTTSVENVRHMVEVSVFPVKELKE